MFPTKGKGMVVSVNLFGHHRTILNKDRLSVSLKGKRVADLIESIKETYPQLTIDSRTHLIIVNNRPARPDTGIKPGDKVSIMPFIGGG